MRLNDNLKTTLTNYVVFESLLYKSAYCQRHTFKQKKTIRSCVCATTSTNCKEEIKTDGDRFHSHGKERNYNCKQRSKIINTRKQKAVERMKQAV